MNALQVHEEGLQELEHLELQYQFSRHQKVTEMPVSEVIPHVNSFWCHLCVFHCVEYIHGYVYLWVVNVGSPMWVVLFQQPTRALYSNKRTNEQ